MDAQWGPQLDYEIYRVKCPFERLPSELRGMIAVFLEPLDLVSAAQACCCLRRSVLNWSLANFSDDQITFLYRIRVPGLRDGLIERVKLRVLRLLMAAARSTGNLPLTTISVHLMYLKALLLDSAVYTPRRVEMVAIDTLQMVWYIQGFCFEVRRINKERSIARWEPITMDQTTVTSLLFYWLFMKRVKDLRGICNRPLSYERDVLGNGEDFSRIARQIYGDPARQSLEKSLRMGNVLTTFRDVVCAANETVLPKIFESKIDICSRGYSWAALFLYHGFASCFRLLHEKQSEIEYYASMENDELDVWEDHFQEIQTLAIKLQLNVLN